eukprot:jgi/Mesen1/5037/ME000025S04433
MSRLMAPFGTIKTVQDGVVLTIVLSRPDRKNAMNSTLYAELAVALAKAADDSTVHAVILTGEGDYFSSGADLSEGSVGGPNPILAPVGQFMLGLLHFPKLIVAAVNGHAVGIGVTLLPHCDISYAATTATFWAPFARIAIVPEFCSSVTFPRILGPSLANEMLMGSKKIGADEAKTTGLVSELFPPETLLPDVQQRVKMMLEQPLAHDSFPLFKRMMKRSVLRELEDVLMYELSELSRRAARGDTDVGLKSTLEEQRRGKALSRSRL